MRWMDDTCRGVSMYEMNDVRMDEMNDDIHAGAGIYMRMMITICDRCIYRMNGYNVGMMAH